MDTNGWMSMNEWIWLILITWVLLAVPAALALGVLDQFTAGGRARLAAKRAKKEKEKKRVLEKKIAQRKLRDKAHEEGRSKECPSCGDYVRWGTTQCPHCRAEIDI